VVAVVQLPLRQVLRWRQTRASSDHASCLFTRARTEVVATFVTASGTSAQTKDTRSLQKTGHELEIRTKNQFAGKYFSTADPATKMSRRALARSSGPEHALIHTLLTRRL